MKNTEQPLRNAKRKKQAYRFLQGVMLLAYALFAGSWIYAFTVFPELNGRALSQAERTAISRVGSIRGFGEWAVYLSFFGICVLVCTQKKSFLGEIAAIGKSFLLLGLACAACSSGYYLAVGSTVWNFTEPLFFFRGDWDSRSLRMAVVGRRKNGSGETPVCRAKRVKRSEEKDSRRRE